VQEGFKEKGKGCAWGQITCPQAHEKSMSQLSVEPGSACQSCLSLIALWVCIYTSHYTFK